MTNPIPIQQAVGFIGAEGCQYRLTLHYPGHQVIMASGLFIDELKAELESLERLERMDIIKDHPQVSIEPSGRAK